MPTRDEIQAAAAAIGPHVRHTPVIEIPGDTLGIVAAPFAALLTGRWVPEPGARIGVVLCGANVVNTAFAPATTLV
ncbi:hypothetical protein [Demequina sp.]|uniref:hypothetical protein n=1 Tax=Demequina sp. TaxID=2050685 RepID=UPI0025D181A8|nr:hypothetical protein [Demequina sp.]